LFSALAKTSSFDIRNFSIITVLWGKENDRWSYTRRIRNKWLQ
jgi:hypothetical protein